jgi:hypothetical protein
MMGLRVVSSRMVMSTIKILAVNTHTLYLDWIIYLMKCLPNLEKLYVQVTILYFCSVNKYTTFINIGYTISILDLDFLFMFFFLYFQPKEGVA